LPTWRLVRYVDDFAVLVNGDQNETEALREDVTQVLASMGVAAVTDQDPCVIAG
jgi:RNA-directed DNA polymerase